MQKTTCHPITSARFRLPVALALLLLLTLATLSIHAEIPQTPEEHFDAAIVLLKADEPRDIEAAMKHLQVAAEMDFRAAQRVLGKLYLDRYRDTGVPVDGERAREWIEKAAGNGDSSAQEYLAIMYDSGVVVEQDLVRAIEWYRKSADAGNRRAQFSLALEYYVGQGVDKDLEEAVCWFESAAAQGHSEAQILLGVLFRDGEGVAKDHSAALNWFLLAAAQNKPDAFAHLGYMYKHGLGVPRDEVEANWHYQQAAALGSADGHVKLAGYYLAEKDIHPALFHIEEAARLGNAGGEYLLGWVYETGRGVAADEAQAIAWYTKAAENGSEKATAALERIRKKNQSYTERFVEWVTSPD